MATEDQLDWRPEQEIVGGEEGEFEKNESRNPGGESLENRSSYRKVSRFLYLTRFNPSISEKEIENVMSAYGKVTAVFIRGKNAFVDFETEDEAVAARNALLHKPELGAESLIVDFKNDKPKKDRRFDSRDRDQRFRRSSSRNRFRGPPSDNRAPVGDVRPPVGIRDVPYGGANNRRSRSRSRSRDRFQRGPSSNFSQRDDFRRGNPSYSPQDRAPPRDDGNFRRGRGYFPNDGPSNMNNSMPPMNSMVNNNVPQNIGGGRPRSNSRSPGNMRGNRDREYYKQDGRGSTGSGPQYSPRDNRDRHYDNDQRVRNQGDFNRRDRRPDDRGNRYHNNGYNNNNNNSINNSNSNSSNYGSNRPNNNNYGGNDRQENGAYRSRFSDNNTLNNDTSTLPQ